jgi:hypothetical protein
MQRRCFGDDPHDFLQGLAAPLNYEYDCRPRVGSNRNEGSVTMRTLLLIFSVTFASLTAHAGNQLKPVFLKTNCTLASGSMILSAFKEALDNSKRYELVPDLSDNGKMDVVISVRMICEEDKGNVAIASVYGLVKCFGPKNCHASVDGSTLTALLSEPGLERQSGVNLFKEFDEMQAESKNHQTVLN